MKYCILYCEVKESDCMLPDSFSYFCLKYDNEDNLIKNVKKLTGVSNDLNDLLSDIDCKVSVYTLYSYDKVLKMLSGVKNLDFNLEYLSVSLGLPRILGLYEIFSYFFDSDNVLTELEMLDVLLSSVLTYNTDIQYTYCVVFYTNFSYTFTWFCIDNNTSKLIILGNDKITISNDSYKLYELGKSIKSLRYKMAKSGCCISRTKFLSWDSESVSNDISSYIQEFSTLIDLLKVVKNIPVLDYNKVIRFLSSNIKPYYNFSSSEFVNALSSSSRLLGLKSEVDGSLSFSNNLLYKDYSSCESTELEKQRAKWGIILDCEGNKNNASGLRELGGLIFCRYKNILLSVETFECTEVLLEETLQQVIKNYEVLINRYIPSRGIDIITFGGSDSIMIEESLKNVSNKQFRKKIKRLFRYNDCRPYVLSYLNSEGYTINERKTLSNIASSLGVQVVSPKHNALSDSRTLFNVLAYILQDTGYWILD